MHTYLLLFILNKNGSPSYKIPWILFILILPIPGLLSYIMFAKPIITKKYRTKYFKIVEEVNQIYHTNEKDINELKCISLQSYNQSKYIYNTSSMPLVKNTKTTYFSNGTMMFDSMLDKIKQAKKYVFLETFILSPGYMLDTLIDLLEEKIKEGIEVVYNVSHLPAPAQGDAARIKQVFINILDNALKYTEQGGKIIVYAEIPNPETLIVTVTDTGKGISPEDLPHVKEKFYKANTTVRGSGIGLAVADEIVRLHNGELDIDSVFGEGTTVRIKIPVEPIERDNPEKEGEINPDEQKEM